MERDVGRCCTGPCPTELPHRSGSGRKRKTMRVDALLYPSGLAADERKTCLASFRSPLYASS